MPPTDQERTEQATPKRRRESREKGQVAKSRELCSVSVLLASLGAFYFVGGSMLNKLMELAHLSFSQAHRVELNMTGTVSLFRDTLIHFASILAPFMVIIVAAGLLSNYLQVGVIFSGHTMKPELSKISPLKGFKRLVSLKSLVELVKSLLKLTIVAMVAFLTIRSEMGSIFPLVDKGVWDIFLFLSRVSFKILITTCWVLIILAILDYAYQKWEFEKNLKMSKQEVKDEFKQTEGDPLVRSRIRSLQREMARRRMMESVPHADVVVTNPTHLAVALQYKKEMNAPQVTAKGAGFLAQRIKQIAQEHKVPVIENPGVARLIYKLCDIGKEIPESLYRAVAEILAHVYQLKGRMRT